MADLHVWTTGEDWVVAESAQDATQCMCEQLGCEPEEFDAEEHEWRRLDDAAILSVWCDPDGDIACHGEDGCGPVERSVTDWIKREGRGFLATANW